MYVGYTELLLCLSHNDAHSQMRSDDPVLKSAISMVKQSSSSFKGPLSQSSLRNNSNSSQSSLEDNTTKKTSLPWVHWLLGIATSIFNFFMQLFAFLTLSRSAQVASSETSTNPTVPTNPTAPAADETAKGVEFTNDNKIWDMMQHHYILPVFASARAFVPSSFESLLVQVCTRVQTQYIKVCVNYNILCLCIVEFLCGDDTSNMREAGVWAVRTDGNACFYTENSGWSAVQRLVSYVHPAPGAVLWIIQSSRLLEWFAVALHIHLPIGTRPFCHTIHIVVMFSYVCS